jgi:hypothetical protein
VAEEGVVIRKSLYLHDDVHNGDGTFCPRCNAQIVVIAGHFICSCGYDDEAWVEDIGGEVAARG